MDKKLTKLFVSAVLLSANSVFAYSFSPNKTDKVTVKNIAVAKSKVSLPFQIGGTKSDNLHLLDDIKYIKLGTKILCEDSFTTLPDWSVYDGTTSDILDTQFSNTRLFFDNKDILQRVIFFKLVKGNEEQRTIYNKLNNYLAQGYTHIKTSPPHAMYIDINEVTKDFDDEFYYGWINQDGVSYRSEDGYVSIKKESTGRVNPPPSIQLSKYGLYEEYANLEREIPEWKNGTPEFESVVVQHFSEDFSDLIEKQCEFLYT